MRLGNLLVLAIALGSGALFAANPDVAVLSAVQGDVTYQSESAPALPAKPFMRLRDGDVLKIPPGGEVRVIFLKADLQEGWKGPSVFRVGAKQGEAIQGKPESSIQLPGAVPVKIAALTEIVRTSRPGGVQIRGLPRPKSGYEEAMDAARRTYESLRGRMPEDDITPELYLYSVANEYAVEGEMRRMLDEMHRRRPHDPDVEILEGMTRPGS